MIRHLLVAAAIAFAVVPRVQADAYSCRQAGIDACKGKGPSCCEPPPCLYKYQLTMYRMLQALFGDPAVVACGGSDIEGYVGKLTQTQAFQNALPVCPKEYEGKPLDVPLPLATHRDGSKLTSPCKIFMIQGNGESPIGPGTIGQWKTTCSELNDVNFAHEDYHMQRCKAGGAIEFPSSNQATIANDEAVAYVISVYQTDLLLRHWNERCTPTEDRKEAIRRANEGLKALQAPLAKGKCP